MTKHSKKINFDYGFTPKKLTPLYKALQECELSAINILLDFGFSLSHVTTNGKNAFHYAANRNHAGIMRATLDKLLSLENISN